MIRQILVLGLSLIGIWAAAQTDSTQWLQPQTSDGIEDLYQREDGAGTVELTDQLDILAAKSTNKIDLNRAQKADFEDLGILTPVQIQSLIDYRNTYGKLLAVYELQAVPNWSEATVRLVQPYVFVGGDDLNSITTSETFRTMEHQIVLRSQYEWPLSRGFDGSIYPAAPIGTLLRYRGNVGGGLRWGLTAERDAGEDFFVRSNPQGFDFYAGYLHWQGQKGIFRSVTLGNFRVSIGQGLIYQGGSLTMGKGSGSSATFRTSFRAQPYGSPNESAGGQGVALILEPVKNVELLVYASHRRRDANIIFDTDTTQIDNTEPQSRASSFLTAGLHRTANEIADEGALVHDFAGISAKYSHKKGQISLNSIYHRFNTTLGAGDNPDIYKIYAFTGNKLLNLSADYFYRYRNLMLFGELGKGDTPTPALVQGLLLTVHKKLDLSAVYRYYPTDFHAVDAMPFAEGSQPSNEKGLYFGADLKISKFFALQAYADLWQKPWLTSLADRPAQGQEYYVRLTGSIRRKMDAYLLYQYKTNELNSSSTLYPDFPLRPFGMQTRQKIRFQIQHKFSKYFSWRTRVEENWYQRDDATMERGSLVSQDIIFSLDPLPISGNARLSLFNTDSYNARIYSYENNVAFLYRVPAYYGRGTRSYINLKWRTTRNLTTELHLSKTYYRNRNEIGSGYDKISSNQAYEAVLQLRYSFASSW
jgi:Helix-hairpin-helix motif